MTSVLKKIFLAVFVVVVLAGSASAQTQYTVKIHAPIPIVIEVGEFVRCFTNYGFCSSCTAPCGCLTPGAWQWGMDASSGECALGEEWPDFAVGDACVAPPCEDCWYEVVGNPSTDCWVLEECPSE